MRIQWTAIVEVFVLCFVCLLWCEFGYYYYVLGVKCQDWPGPHQQHDQHKSIEHGNHTRILVISDTHIMGPRKSAQVDKLRREWQMWLSFSISEKIFQPDLIVFLGDILDEASFSYEDVFEEASKDFEKIFASERGRIVVVGNHDVGFHHHMLRFPFLLDRFSQKFKASSSVELIRTGDLNIVSINSMSFSNDSCPFCRQSTSALKKISRELKASKQPYHRPILLTHFPLYREDDTSCEHSLSLSEKVHRKNIEGEHVLHKSSTKLILDLLNPRLVLSGHTHLDCRLNHSYFGRDYEEITVSSYSHKYAEYRPSFLLISANSTHAFSKRCDLVDETTILFTYIVTLVTIALRLLRRQR